MSAKLLIKRQRKNYVVIGWIAIIFLSQGVYGPLGLSSLAIFLMAISLVPVIFLSIFAKHLVCELRFMRYNIFLMLLTIFFGGIGVFYGGPKYPQYIGTLVFHQIFIAAIIIVIRPVGIFIALKCAAYINIFFVGLQILGGLLNIDSLVKLDSLFVMKGENIEYFSLIPRASGLMTEPAHLSYLLLPIILIMSLSSRKENKIYSGGKYLFLMAYFLTFSLVAYMQILGAFLICNLRKLSLKRLFLGVLISLIVFSIYSSIPFAKDRISGVEEIIDGSNTKQSSVFAIQSNALVTFSSLKEAPFFGRGLTSHRGTYDDVIESIYSVPIEENWKGLNQNDAGSLPLLMLSETGLIGFVLFYGFIFFSFKYFYSKIESEISIFGLAFSLSLLFDGIRFGQLASIHLMLSIQMIFYCLAALKSKNQEV